MASSSASALDRSERSWSADDTFDDDPDIHHDAFLPAPTDSSRSSLLQIPPDAASAPRSAPPSVNPRTGGGRPVSAAVYSATHAASQSSRKRASHTVTGSAVASSHQPASPAYIDVYQHPAAVAYAAAHPRRQIPKFGPYLLLQTLGEGEFGKVKLGLHNEWGEEVAVKLIRRGSVDSSVRMTKVEREIEVLRTIKHPNIVRLIDVIETDKYIGIILEYASGGELFDHILAHRYLKERDACKLFAQLISGVSYIHEKKIVHRDLKLENLLLDRNRNVIITDFGFANRFEHRADDLMQTSCGSPCYAAPELVISEGLYVGSAVDIWSCGVILYAMLAGYLPFDDDPANPDGDNINLLYKYIINTPLTFPDYISPEARDLLSKMLVPDPAKRSDLMTIMAHRWLRPYAGLFERSVREMEALALEQQQQKRLASQKQLKAAGAVTKVSRTQSARGDGLLMAPAGASPGGSGARAKPQRATTSTAMGSHQHQELLYETPTEGYTASPARRAVASAVLPTASSVSVPLPAENGTSNGVSSNGAGNGEEVRSRKESSRSKTSGSRKAGKSTHATPTQSNADRKKGAYRHTIQLEYDNGDEEPAMPSPSSVARSQLQNPSSPSPQSQPQQPQTQRARTTSQLDPSLIARMGLGPPEPVLSTSAVHGEQGIIVGPGKGRSELMGVAAASAATSPKTSPKLNGSESTGENGGIAQEERIVPPALLTAELGGLGMDADKTPPSTPRRKGTPASPGTPKARAVSSSVTSPAVANVNGTPSGTTTTTATVTVQPASPATPRARLVGASSSPALKRPPSLDSVPTMPLFTREMAAAMASNGGAKKSATPTSPSPVSPSASSVTPAMPSTSVATSTSATTITAAPSGNGNVDASSTLTPPGTASGTKTGTVGGLAPPNTGSTSSGGSTKSRHRKGLSMDKFGFGKFLGGGSSSSNNAHANASASVSESGHGNGNGAESPLGLGIGSPSRTMSVSGSRTPSGSASPGEMGESPSAAMLKHSLADAAAAGAGASAESTKNSKKGRKKTLSLIEPIGRSIKGGARSVKGASHRVSGGLIGSGSGSGSGSGGASGGGKSSAEPPVPDIKRSLSENSGVPSSHVPATLASTFIDPKDVSASPRGVPTRADYVGSGAALTGLNGTVSTGKAKKVMDWFRKKSLVKNAGGVGLPDPLALDSTDPVADFDPILQVPEPKTPTMATYRGAGAASSASVNNHSQGQGPPQVVVTTPGIHERPVWAPQKAGVGRSASESTGGVKATSTAETTPAVVAASGHLPVAVRAARALASTLPLSNPASAPSSPPRGAPAFHKSMLRVHHGAVDQATITSGSPPEVFAHVTRVLLGMGIQVQTESAFKYRCIRHKRRKTGTGGASSSSAGGHGKEGSATDGLAAYTMIGAAASNGVDKRGLPLPSPSSSGGMFKGFLMRRSSSQAPPPPHILQALRTEKDAADQETPSPSSQTPSNTDLTTPSLPAEPLYGDRTADQGDEVRFSVELTRIDRLEDTYSLDIRRLKGNLRSYKFLYDTLRERCDFPAR